MNKMKVHELAKKFNISSKEVIEKASKAGITLTSHMSVIEGADIKKVEKAIASANIVKTNASKKPSSKEDKPSAKKEKSTKKEDKPVIIRREVIIADDNVQTEVKKQPEKNMNNFEQPARKTDYNIVYRNKVQKPLTVSELFGLKPTETKKEEVVPEKQEISINEMVEENKIPETVEDTSKVSTEEISENVQDSANDFSKNPTENSVPNVSSVSNTSNGANTSNVQKSTVNREFNNRPRYQDNMDNKGFNKKPYNQDNRGFNNRPGFQNRNDGYRPNNGFNNQNKPDRFNNNRPGFNNNRPDRPGFNNNRQGFNNRPDRPGFNNRPDRPGFNNNNRPGFNNRPDRPGFNNNRPGYQQNQGFNRNNNYQNRQGFNNNNRRPLDNYGIEKNIKDIMSAESMEKENVREYRNKVIDKQKFNSKFDERKTKKQGKLRKNNNEIDTDKLKDLKQSDKLSNMFNEGSMLDYYDLTTERGRKGKRRNIQDKIENKQKIFKLTDITIGENISVKDLSIELKKTSAEVIKKLFDLGIMATINHDLDFDTAFLVSQEFGVNVTKKETVKEEDILFDESVDEEGDLIVRPPVVVVMGHVDHGKTSLLDTIRKTNVIEGEAGGITQHIGAYKVSVNGREITFLDTPGHEAFTSMRARGAQITDIAILVVAANDGIMPQTIEAINHAKAANIPIVVAVNKIDLEGANVDKIKEAMTEYGLVSEEWGGDTIFVPISAKFNKNIEQLLEMVLLIADMKELKVNPNKQAKGVVIEARLSKRRGPIASVLVQRGTLDVGDTVVVGSTIGRIREMTNDKGQKVRKAGASTPVEITGLSTVPEAGEVFYEVSNEKAAKQLIERRKRQVRDAHLKAGSKVTAENLLDVTAQSNVKTISVIIKADVQGSVEAVKQAVEKLTTPEIKIKIVHSSVGAVNESDINLAIISNSKLIAFNVLATPTAKSLAEKSNLDIKPYSIIYKVIEDIEREMKGLKEPEYEHKTIGTAEVRQVFKVSNTGNIAGCYVTTGKIVRNAIVKVIRDGDTIHEGKVSTLKRFKDDVKEVNHGYECGIQIADFNDVKEGDTLEMSVLEEKTM